MAPLTPTTLLSANAIDAHASSAVTILLALIGELLDVRDLHGPRFSLPSRDGSLSNAVRSLPAELMLL
jgi:hypothetical protein